MANTCLDCGKKTTKKELKKYGGICSSCADEMVESPNRTRVDSETRVSTGNCIGVILEGSKGSLKLEICNN
tara:strand:- start:13231 stop:13443 length:213 start_codon:yes stop_codon:yes gene_type:complete